jgi:hypothetical protein
MTYSGALVAKTNIKIIRKNGMKMKSFKKESVLFAISDLKGEL